MGKSYGVKKNGRKLTAILMQTPRQEQTGRASLSEALRMLLAFRPAQTTTIDHATRVQWYIIMIPSAYIMCCSLLGSAPQGRR